MWKKFTPCKNWKNCANIIRREAKCTQLLFCFCWRIIFFLTYTKQRNDAPQTLKRSHPTYVLALSSTNRSAELSPPPTSRAYIRGRWTLGAQSTLGGRRGRWGGGDGESPFGESGQNSRKKGGTVKKKTWKKTHPVNFPSFGPMGNVNSKENRRKMLT